MGKRKLDVTRQLQRIAALPYNDYFKEEVKQIRVKYLLPVARAGKSVLSFFSECVTDDNNYVFLRYIDPEADADSYISIFGLPENTSSAEAHRFLEDLKEKKQAKSIADAEVPLEQDIVQILERFGLPERAFPNVFWYVLLDWEEKLLTGLVGLLAQSHGTFETGIPRFKITIYGLGPWTQKRQWDKVWHDLVKTQVEFCAEVYEQVWGIPRPSKKRATLQSYDDQMQTWSEWFNLSEVQGRGPKEALEEWEHNHPDQRGRFDLSTVTKAIQGFREVITPKPDRKLASVNSDMLGQTLQKFAEARFTTVHINIPD